MKLVRYALIIILSICFSGIYASENDSLKIVSEQQELAKGKPKKEKDPDRKRTGWTFGILPSVAYDADLGFQYGVLSNIYYFGDGSTYPEYLHSLYVEAAYTTRNYGLFRLSYDSKYAIPNHRLTVDLVYMPDAMCDFYG